ncbi:DUF3667 domain-containing protein [Pontibacter ramchanderi]|uniref:Uncharacterized protein DUF3667 n=1 Tax=Pontibacter ramchanderi TaxID=1179743 RepID=A0A2N3UD95_9BACT|nr:DUF3667 domain-containing protein [Pontibacter ramchanderi]PKV67350.1 uncharacterized protein DUF3667 [Pontibacter ramchanderi]
MAKRRRKFIQCPNCGYTFEEVNNYCPNCGQENHDLNVPVKHLVEEFFESTLHYDTKFLRTLKYLITRPGYLTEKFNLGQRASFVPPFRLYVFISIFFFTTVAVFASKNFVVSDSAGASERLKTTDPEAAARILQADSLARTRIGFTFGDTAVVASSDTTDLIINEEVDSKFRSFLKNEEQSRQRLLKNISFMMFVLMPFFGFILYLFYRSQRRNYVEHLMFSVHFHTFVFLLIMFAILLEVIFPTISTEGWVFLISTAYLFFALRYVYKESYLLTAVRLIPIGFVYLLSLAILFVTTVGISVLFS